MVPLDPSAPLSRRTALRHAGALAVAVSALEMAGPLAVIPERAAAAIRPPDTQFDNAAFLARPRVSSPR